MIFGIPSTFAIEVGELFTTGDGVTYVQFQFLLAGRPFGNWPESISLQGSAAGMREFLENAAFRRDESAGSKQPDELFASTFEAFYDYDYSRNPVRRPNLRDIYHLNEVGLGATCDRFGIVVIEVADDSSRIIAKDRRSDIIVLDHLVASSEIARAGQDFIRWAEARLAGLST